MDVSPALPAHQRLRAATQGAHDKVDTAYGGFDLRDRAGYGAFLTAHARVLPALERVLHGYGLPETEPRGPALANDLQALVLPLPDPLPVDPPRSTAEAWAMLYVVEGSRLGGVMLARTVGPDLPHAYLSAAHGRGAWRALLAGMDAAAEGEAWMEEAIGAAWRVFDLYAHAAALPLGADPAGSERPSIDPRCPSPRT